MTSITLRKHGSNAYYGQAKERNDANFGHFVADRLVHLSPVDIVIVVFYFALVLRSAFI